MDETQVYECLCNKDTRNPLYRDIYGWQEDPPKAASIAERVAHRVCACDNCFYGRDQLALEIIRLRELLRSK